MQKKIFIFFFFSLLSLVGLSFALPARADWTNGGGFLHCSVPANDYSVPSPTWYLHEDFSGALTNFQAYSKNLQGGSDLIRVQTFGQWDDINQRCLDSSAMTNVFYTGSDTSDYGLNSFYPSSAQDFTGVHCVQINYYSYLSSFCGNDTLFDTQPAVDWMGYHCGWGTDCNIQQLYFNMVGVDVAPVGVPLTIDSPPDNSTIQGLSAEIAGACDNDTGTSTTIYVSNNYIPDYSPYFSGTGTCVGNRYTLGFQVQQYGTYTFTVSHADNRTDTANITLTFSQYASGGSWLAGQKFVANLSATSTVAETNPWIINGDDGYNINDVPVYFHFAQDVISASSTYVFLLQNETSTSTSPITVLHSTVLNMGLTAGVYTMHVNFSTTTPQTFHAYIRHTGGTGWDESELLNLSFFPAASIGDVYDFGNYFPKLKAVLEKKILFAQYFQMYDSLTGHFNTLSGTSTPFSAKMYVMTDNNTYTKSVDVFNLDTPVVKSFSNPIRPFFVGLLWVLFAVYVIKKLWDLAKNLRV